MGVTLTIIKSAHKPLPTCGNRVHPDNFQNKSITPPFS